MITAKETYMKKMDGKENMPVLEISYIVNTGGAFDDGKDEAQRDEAIRRLKGEECRFERHHRAEAERAYYAAC